MDEARMIFTISRFGPRREISARAQYMGLNVSEHRGLLKIIFVITGSSEGIKEFSNWLWSKVKGA